MSDARNGCGAILLPVQTYFWMGLPGLAAGHTIAAADLRFYSRLAHKPFLFWAPDAREQAPPVVERRHHGASAPRPANVLLADADTAGQVLFETVFEMVRIAEFPEMPSRFESVFVWEQLGWARGYHNGAPYADLYEVRVAEQQKLHRGDFGLCTNYHLPETMEKMRERARRYWRGEMDGKYETLIEGRIEILRRLPPIEAR